MNKKSVFGSALITVGFLFLANPYLSLLDVLPDFVGYIFIMFGIRALTHIDDRVAFAARKLPFLAAVSAGRLLSFIFFIGSGLSTVMLLSFSFGVAETILAIVFFGDFFGGIGHLCERHGSLSSLTELVNVRVATVVFYLAKIWLAFIPELASVFEVEMIVEPSYPAYYAEIVSYRPLAILFLMLPVLFIGIWWFIRVYRYFRTLRKDKALADEISASYDEYVSSLDPVGETLRRLRTAFIIIAVGYAFLFDLNVNGIPVFPDTVATLLIFAGAAAADTSNIRKLALPTTVAAVAQTAYAVVFRLFTTVESGSYVHADRLADLSATDLALLSVAVIAYAVSSVWFIIRVGQLIMPGLKRSAYVLFIGYHVLTAAGVIAPELYAWMKIPRIILILLFIFFALKRCYIHFGKLAEEKEQ